MDIKTKKITYCAMLTAAAIVLGYIEFLIPVNTGVPGIKIGLSNIATLVALYMFGAVPAILVLICRIFLSAFLFGSLSTLIYSLTGGLSAFAVMFLMIKIKKPVFSIVGISTAGGVFHNIGQLLIAAIILKTMELGYYLPVLMISGIIAGTVTGILSRHVIKLLKN